ncbi:MAG: Wzz/FepE/Etk N-terminal domain-containing protein, partial [Ignavibacteria bacterium]|nr:Wzz/FepE/Etk N-terminal domain-containing protein [Ignavibacteria bacterium]
MTDPNNTETTDKVNDGTTTKYLLVFLKHWKVIVSVTLIVGIITTILAFFVIKPEYLSTAVIKASGKTSLGLGGLLSSAGIPDLGGFEELTGSVMIKELALYEEILQSRRCLEEVIKKYNLMQEYDYRFMQDAVKDFRENKTYITKNLKAGTIEIGVYDINPQRAKEIVEYMIELLNTINIEMNVQNAK